METVTLKNSNLAVSRLCMGGCPMGGYGWGTVSQQDLILAVHKAIDMGINFFDSADTYGLGQAETTLGEALKGKRHKAVIATKFGVRVENGKTFYDNSPRWIQNSIESSLRRLDTDYIDLYQIHYRDAVTPISEVIDCLDKLKEKGHIRYYGLSNIFVQDIQELEAVQGKFVSFQDEYSLACRKNEKDMLELPDKLQLTPLTWGSLGQGILTGKDDQNSAFGNDDRRSREIYANFHGDTLRQNLKIVEAMRGIAGDLNKPLSAVAIRWILDYIPESVVIAGIKNISQLLSNTEAMGWKLDDQHIRQLEVISRKPV